MVVLDGLQDPGNAGAIVRAAEAFGATGVMFLKGTVSPLQSEDAARFGRIAVSRAVPVRRGCRRWRAPRCGSTAWSSTPACRRAPAPPCARWRDVDLTRRCALIIGNEGARREPRTARGARIDVSIPTVGVESLNAAVAAGILLYEARRQRALRAMSLFDATPARRTANAPDAQASAGRAHAPRALDDYVGQEHILGPGKPLRRQIERDELTLDHPLGTAGRRARPRWPGSSRA